MRPSQPPSVALAMVMKGLEDELAHLKLSLGQHQAAYKQHDASLSKHRRKALWKRMVELLTTIDRKADQIYSLYDVLEGQKESGQMMTEEHLEVTLHSIGIDVNELGRRTTLLDDASKRQTRPRVGTDGGEKDVQGTARFEVGESSDDENDHDDEEDEEGELPWEGIEETGQLTQEAPFGNRSRRSSVAV